MNTLAKLLKEKNQLVARISELKTRISTNNVTLSPNKSKYDIKSEYNALRLFIVELVAVKAKIARANVPVYDKIFKLSELKSQISFLKSLDTSEGVIQRHYLPESGSEIRTAQIDALFVDSEVERLGVELSTLQDELDTYNHSTKID